MGDTTPPGGPHIGDILNPGNTTPKNRELTRNVTERVEQESEGPRYAKIKGTPIIAIQEEGYYLAPELYANTPKPWSLRIKDCRYPQGRLCTPTIRLDEIQKLLTSRLATPIRDAYKAIYYEKANEYLNKTLILLQTYAQEFEIIEPELSYQPKKPVSKADRLVDLAHKQEIQLFRDQFGVQYGRIPVKKWSCEASEANSLLITPHPQSNIDIQNTLGGHLKENSSTSSTASLIHQIWPINSETFKQWLSGLMWSTDNEAAKREHINSSITVLCAIANENPTIHLYNRIAPDGNGGIFIDMTNENWEAYHITAEGWSIITQPVVFRRYPHQLPLCYPSQNPDISKLFKYLNIGCLGNVERHVNEQLLYLVGFITAYIPNIPHVGTVLHGGAGRSKTGTQVNSRKLIDPSSVIYNALPSKGKLTSLIQVLEQHYYPVFDNLGDLDDDISDVFCRAITGAAFQLRKLFTDNEAYLRAYKRVVNMNGINIPGEKPDLLDRVQVFETMYIPMSMRRSETEINAEFEQDAPDILAAILDVLVKALQIYPTIKLERLPRMADYALWGCAVTEALGIEHSKFITAYYQNMLNVKGEVVKNRITGNLLIELLDSRLGGTNVTSFNILTSKLHYQLMGKAKEYNMDTRNLPPDPTRLSRELNTIAENLPSLGYVMTKKNTNKGVELTFSLLKGTTLDSTLEDKAESYKNVWNVTDLTQLLKNDSKTDVTITEEAQVKQLEPPKRIQDQLQTIHGYIFDNGTVNDIKLSYELNIKLPELRKLLDVLVRNGLIEQVPPNKFKAKKVSQ